MRLPDGIDIDAFWSRRQVAGWHAAKRVVLVLRQTQVMRRGDEAEVIGRAGRGAYDRGPPQDLGALEVREAFERRIERHRGCVIEARGVDGERAGGNLVA